MTSKKVTSKKKAHKKTAKHHYIFIMGHGAGDPGARGAARPKPLICVNI
ncbi:hypothetical protein [Lactiplantibacillus carotarum]|nr:hypothetical protein [Lactiplantibacillus carotarum]